MSNNGNGKTSRKQGRKPTKNYPHLTDLGNAERFAAMHGNDVRFCHPWKTWLVWDGCRWARDEIGEAMRKARATVRRILIEAAQIPIDDDGDDDGEDGDGGNTKASQAKKLKDKMIKHGMASEARHRIEAMVKLAQSEEGIPILPAKLDAFPMLFNCANGTIDLRTGELQEPRREDYLTQQSPIHYEPGMSDCPIWKEMLRSIFQNDEKIVAFLKRLLGYYLTGDVREDFVAIFFGDGSNGKSTLLKVLEDILKDYATPAPTDLVMARRRDSHPTVFTVVHGKRLVLISETQKRRQLDEEMVKRLSGRDRIMGRGMHENYWPIEAHHKILLSTNYKPIIKGRDHAIWRRLALVPFAARFWDQDKGEKGPPEFKADKTLPAKLQCEYPRILAWMVEGCLEWQNKGLDVPNSVQSATKDYRSEQDDVGRWSEECCERHPDYQSKANELYQSYVSWAKANNEEVMSNAEFGSALATLGLTKTRLKTGNFWNHIRLQPQLVANNEGW